MWIVSAKFFSKTSGYDSKLYFQIEMCKRISLCWKGYGINKMDLINNNYNVNQSSIRTLAKTRPGEDLVTGEHSFGAFMEREGYCALPSPSNPKPGKNLSKYPF